LERKATCPNGQNPTYLKEQKKAATSCEVLVTLEGEGEGRYVILH
jgi:hypothetical protein